MLKTLVEKVDNIYNQVSNLPEIEIVIHNLMEMLEITCGHN